MRQAIANLIDVARLSFNAKAHASPASPLKPPVRCIAIHIAPEPVRTRPIKEIAMQKFVRSPLAAAASMPAAQIDSIDAIYSHADVQRAAGQLQLRRARLLELAGFRSAVAEAILAVGESGSVTPEQVATTLSRLADGCDEEIAAAREDKALHDACHKGRLTRIQPLRNAVSTRLSALVVERDNLHTRLDAIRRASTQGAPAANHRYKGLLAAGISREQIAALGIDSPDDQIGGIKARIAEIEAGIVPLSAFGTTGDVAHLAGLGLGDLIARAYPERAAEEVTA